MKETLRSEWVKCGKKCSGCPHGPYWYAYWRAEGKLHKRYIGKGKPAEPEPAEPEPPNPWDDIFDDRKASARLAYTILGIHQSADLGAVKARWKVVSWELHPDRSPGASELPFKRASAAYSYLRRYLAR